MENKHLEIRDLQNEILEKYNIKYNKKIKSMIF